ncbi:MAG: hypothetical protein CMN00_07215 [Rickettsiales bacterium]|nr:hypothetical protein [Rickettsiales bacterium]|tara:strand:- start:220 stop:420 length:201 start_codon:yes stop_codon:yes gene_type:complete
MNSIIFLVLVFSLLPGFLYAYLDGGFLSMILQFFVAFVAMALVYLRLTITKIKDFFKKFLSFFKIK